MTVQDDGIGFTPHEAESASSKGLGIKTMKDLMQEIGGVLEIRSEKGKGSLLEVQVPHRL